VKADDRAILAAVAASPDGVHVLATVVRVRGSAYRRCGARMLVHANGVVVGSVSGGCLEGEIARKGSWWARSGPVVKRFSATADEDDTTTRSGCGGTIDVLIENVRADDPHGPLAALRWIAAQRTAARMTTVIAGPATGARHATTDHATWPGGGNAHDDRASASTLVEEVAAPRELLVAGRHHDIAPLVRMARAMGWEVTNASRGVARHSLGDPDHVIAPTPDAVSAWAADRPDAAIVLMTHDIDLDRVLLDALLPVTTPRYLGILGPAHRTERIVDELAVSPRALASIRSPVGLDLGGDGPEAVALSIVADIQATWHDRDGGRLCAPGSGSWSGPRLVVIEQDERVLVNAS
jgi:xanthine dehydrogenase accessory factor